MNGSDKGLLGVPINSTSLFAGYYAPESPILTDGKVFLDEWNRQRAERASETGHEDWDIDEIDE
ncbi:MAG: hypothetical protein GY694_17490 [Gammaproteobacteria bacterium]|nr:hypothetical protein [Gammaproteobacteria bacterium]